MGTMQVQVEPTNLPNDMSAPRLDTSAPAGAFGEGLAAGMHQLAQGITAAGAELEREQLKAKQKADAAAVLNMYSQIGIWEQKNISDPEVRDAQGNVINPGGALASRGMGAQGVTNRTLQSFNDFSKQLLAQAKNDEQKQAILHHILSARNGIANNVGAHERREFDQYVKESAAGGIGTAVNEGVNAAINWPPIGPDTAPFPKAVLDAYEKGLSIVNMVADIDGYPPEKRIAEEQKYNTRFWTTIQEKQQTIGNSEVVLLIDKFYRRPAPQRGYAGMNEERLTEMKYDDKLEVLGLAKRSQAIMNAIQDLPFSEQIAEGQKIQETDPVLGGAVLKRVVDRDTLRKRAHNEEQEGVLNVVAGEFARRIVAGSFPLTPTDLPEWGQLDGRYRVQFALKAERAQTQLGNKTQAAIDARAVGRYLEMTIDDPEGAKRVNIRATFPEASDKAIKDIASRKASHVKGSQLGFGTTIGEVRTKLNSIPALQGEDHKDERAVIVGHVMDWYEKQEKKPDQATVNGMIDALVAPHLKKPNAAASIINSIFGTDFGTKGPGYKVILQGGKLTPQQAASYGIDTNGNVAKPAAPVAPAPAPAAPAAPAAPGTPAPLVTIPLKGHKVGDFWLADRTGRKGIKITQEEAKDPVKAAQKYGLNPSEYRVLGATR